MKYERKFIVSNLYETSKSNEDIALLSNDAKAYEVCDLDQMKDAMNYGTGVRKIGSALNAMKPMTGDKTRNSKLLPIFHDDNEFRMAVDATKQRYESEFFKEISFTDKKIFEEEYIKADYFQKLEEWHGMS